MNQFMTMGFFELLAKANSAMFTFSSSAVLFVVFMMFWVAFFKYMLDVSYILQSTVSNWQFAVDWLKNLSFSPNIQTVNKSTDLLAAFEIFSVLFKTQLKARFQWQLCIFLFIPFLQPRRLSNGFHGRDS